MGEQGQLAGLGKLYVTTADDKNLEHLQEVKVHKIDFKDIPYDVEHHWNEKDKGFTITATARIDCPEGNKQVQKLLKQLTEGEGRLPRKEKKRRINRIMRNERALIGLILLTMINPMQVHDMVACLLFPECIGRAEGCNVSVVCLKNPAQTRLIHLFTKRITKNNVKLLKKLWNRDRRLLAFEVSYRLNHEFHDLTRIYGRNGNDEKKVPFMWEPSGGQF